MKRKRDATGGAASGQTIRGSIPSSQSGRGIDELRNFTMRQLFRRMDMPDDDFVKWLQEM